MWYTTLHDQPAPLLPWGVAIGASLVAAVTDARSRRIPNLLTLPLVLSGWIRSFSVCGAAGLGDSLAGTLLLAAPFVILFAFGGGGAGDAKLMGGIGAWLGLVDGFVALLAVCLAGFVLGVAFAVWRKRLGAVLANLTGAAHALLMRSLPAVDDGQKMPYGIAISAGTVVAAGFTWIWRTRTS